MESKNQMEIGSWRRSQYFEKLWPDFKLDIWENKFDHAISSFEWTGDGEIDYRRMADVFYQAGYNLATEIIQSGADNAKTDSWLLADFFMFRQAIELILP